MPKDNETVLEYRKRMDWLCENAFAHHKLHVVQPYDHEVGIGVYRCQRPDSWFYGFHIAFLPGGVISLYGDITGIQLELGEECEEVDASLRLKPGHGRAIGWLRRNWQDIRYLMEKAEPAYRKDVEFFPAEVLPDIYEMEKQEEISSETARKLRMAWDERPCCKTDDPKGRQWYHTYFEITDDCEIDGRWDDWGPCIYYAQHALGTFVRLYEASLEQDQGAA